MRKLLKKLTSQKGQGTVEYALLTIGIIGVIAAVLITTGAGNALQTAITAAYTAIVTAISGATGSGGS